MLREKLVICKGSIDDERCGRKAKYWVHRFCQVLGIQESQANSGHKFSLSKVGIWLGHPEPWIILLILLLPASWFLINMGVPKEVILYGEFLIVGLFIYSLVLSYAKLKNI